MRHPASRPEPDFADAEASVPPGIALAIGTLPHQDPDRALEIMLQACPEAPCWPQLPSRGFQETMIAQFAEGVPCVRIDREGRRIFLVRPEQHLEEVTSFYEAQLGAEQSGDLSAFALSPGYARGFHAFVERLSGRADDKPPFVKGQVTGPLTFGLSLLDEQGLPALYDPTLSDVVRKSILMKGRWQLERLRPLAEKTILFVDEPILASFGSAALISLSREQAVAHLREIFSALRAAGALVGSHCCGNTDWSLLIEAGVEIINFDAFLYRESLGLYADSVARFLGGGGLLAWGMVPSESRYQGHAAEELLALLEQGIRALAAKGVPEALLRRNLVITTSCGLGTLKEPEAEAAMETLKRLSELVRERL
ncbi:MAG: methionine synthase [bacterium]